MKTIIITAALLLAGLAATPAATAAKYGCDGSTLQDDLVCLATMSAEPVLLCDGTAEGVVSCIVAGERAAQQEFHERLCQKMYQCTV